MEMCTTLMLRLAPCRSDQIKTDGSIQQIVMDLLTRESETLALLQESILLLPNSLAVKEIPDPPTSLRATHKLELVMKYALAEVKILICLTKPLDFTILTPALLPNASILDLVEVEENTSLVDRGVNIS